MNREWSKLVEPMVARCELAAKLGMNATWNSDGATALGKLLKKMATTLDDEIERQRRRWNGYALLEHDESIYAVYLGEPQKDDVPLNGLVTMGWRVVSVEIVEAAAVGEEAP